VVRVKVKLLVLRLSLAVMFEVEVFWVVTLCVVVIGYRHFRSPCSRVERQHGPLKHWYPTTKLNDVTTQKTSI